MTTFYRVTYDTGTIDKIKAENAGLNQLRLRGRKQLLAFPFIYKQNLPEYECFDTPEGALKSLVIHARKQLGEAASVYNAAIVYAARATQMTVESIL